MSDKDGWLPVQCTNLAAIWSLLASLLNANACPKIGIAPGRIGGSLGRAREDLEV